MKHLEDAAGDVTPGLEFPGHSKVYEHDADLEPIPAKCAWRLMAIPSQDSGLKKTQVGMAKVQQLIKDFVNAKEPNSGFNTVDDVAYGAAYRQVS